MRALAADEYVPLASLQQCGQLHNPRPSRRGNHELADAPHRARWWQSAVATLMFAARARCCWRGGLCGVIHLAGLMASASQILASPLGAAASKFGRGGWSGCPNFWGNWSGYRFQRLRQLPQILRQRSGFNSKQYITHDFGDCLKS